MLTAESAFALFLMLALASAVYWIASRAKLPYTVLLTFLGILLVPLSSVPAFAFLREFQLTPELLFYIFLPTLLFESAYNMHIRRLVEEFNPIMLLAVLGYLISSFAIGGALWFVLGLMGLSVPFLVTLLFGALISATDPVAVLALFKEFGAPRRLTLLFEGESLANDATALALFLIVLGFFETGISTEGLLVGGLTFATMLVGGALVGLIIGATLVKAIQFFRDNEIVAITLMIVLAHLTFLVAEILGHQAEHYGIEWLKFSPIIATTVAALFMGNYGRYKVTPLAEEFVDKFWAQFAFMANSIVFILLGFLFASVPQGIETLWFPVLLTIVVVMASRALSIYSVLIPFNIFASQKWKVPFAWQHLLAWGSLRGALAVMLVLLIPEHATVPGWNLDLTVREFLLVLTVSCIFFTLFIKAPTIGPMMRWLKVDELSDDEKAAEKEAADMLHARRIAKLKEFGEKGYIPKKTADDMAEGAIRDFQTLSVSPGKIKRKEMRASERVLKQYVIGLEKEVLKTLLAFGEVTERVFKRIYGKLTLQGEAIEAGLPPDPHKTHDALDVFENLGAFVRGAVVHKTQEEQAEEDLLYYRAQEILARKVLKELALFEKEFGGVLIKEALAEMLETYSTYRTEAREKASTIRTMFPDVARNVDARLAGRSMFRVKEKQLGKLHHRGLLTPKLYIKLRDESERSKDNA